MSLPADVGRSVFQMIHRSHQGARDRWTKSGCHSNCFTNVPPNSSFHLKCNSNSSRNLNTINYFIHAPLNNNAVQLKLITNSKLMSYRATVRLRALAGVAKPNPKMGQALGPLGINMMKFCEQFNKVTSHIRGDVPMRIRLTAFTDRTFKFIVKPPETVWFLKKAASQYVFSPNPGHEICGSVAMQYIYEIAKIKKEVDPGLKKIGMPQIMTMVVGQIYSCGLSIHTQKANAIPTPIKYKI